MAKRKVTKKFSGSLRALLCQRVAKIAAYTECNQPELAKHHAKELQQLLIDRGLLVADNPPVGHNGPQSQKT